MKTIANCDIFYKMPLFNLKEALEKEIQSLDINVVLKDKDLLETPKTLLADSNFGLGELIYSLTLTGKPSFSVLRFEDLILVRHFLNKALVASKPIVLLALYNDLPKREPFPVPYFETISYFNYPPAIHIWPKNLEEAVNILNNAFELAYLWSLPFVILLPISFYFLKYNRFPVVNFNIKTPSKKSETIPVLATDHPLFREEEIYRKVENYAKAEQFNKHAQTLIIASGPLAQRVETYLLVSKLEVGLFRPIFLSPFPKRLLGERLPFVKKVFLFDQIIPYLTLVEKSLKRQEKLFIKRVFLPRSLSDSELIKTISGVL